MDDYVIELDDPDIAAQLLALEAEDAAAQAQKPLPAAERFEYEGAFAALMRSAGGDPAAAADGGRLMERLHRQALTKSDERLKEYGCDFIAGGYLFLRALEAPADARDYVLILLGMTRGDARENYSITDERIADFSGLGVRTVQRKRASLIEWQQAKNWTLVRIEERPYNPATQRYEANRYRTVFADYVTAFVREMRDYHISRSSLTATTSSSSRQNGVLVEEQAGAATEAGAAVSDEPRYPVRLHDDAAARFANRISQDFPDAPFVARKAKPKPKPVSTESMLFKRRDAVLGALAAYCDEVKATGGDIEAHIQALEQELLDVIRRYT